MAEVFVSYARRDGEHLKELRTHLKPFERAGKLRLWYDEKIEGGEPWNDEILRALERCKVAVLLVTKHFMASDYIAEQEMPRLLRRQAEGAVTLIPVFLGVSAADREPFPFENARGELEKVLVSAFNGFGSPKEPLLHLGAGQRDWAFQKLASRLEQLVGPVKEPVRYTAAAEQESADVEVSVLLARSAGLLHISYQKPFGKVFGSHAQSWPDVESTLRPIVDKIGQWRLSEIEKWFESPEAVRDGELLFQVLFDDWRATLETIFGRPAAPNLGTVRLRVMTREPLLLDVPWRLLAFEGRPLVEHRWTIATGWQPDPDAAIVTEPGHEVLLLAETSEAEHVEKVRELIFEAWGERADEHIVSIARAQDLEKQASGLRPHLIYVAAAAIDGARAFRLDGGDIAFDELARRFPVAQAVVLSLDGSGGCAARAAKAFAAAPLVIARRLAERSSRTESSLLGWLGRWLRQGRDPVAAWHELERGLETSSALVCADYRSWTVKRPHRLRSQRIQWLIDRIDQKSRMRHELDELIHSDRRVLALIAHAPEGGGAEHAGDQLISYLEMHAGEAMQVKREDLRLPELRGAELHRQLEHDVEMQLDRLDGETPARMLRRHGPQIKNPRTPKVLWLDWGTYGGRHGRIRTSQLQAWLRFCHDYLGRHVVDDRFQLVSFLCVEVEPAKLETFGEKIEAMHDSPWGHGPGFRFVDLPPLGAVPRKELRDFLEMWTDCPPGHRDELARRLVRRTEGAFEPIVRWVERAEEESWGGVLHELRSGGAAPAPGDDEAF